MPCTRSLFQSIQSLYKTAEMLGTCRINKAWGLTHINLLLKNTMQKSILDIKLSKEPSTSNSQGERQANGSRLDNWTERVFIIKTIPLFETLCN
jgi:hypothetical protein